ncbi:MAG: dTMP kinase [Candidatus Omnitrophica bacterium]|nr:dTMP kinase [Candidatus Omnitrophota bacterium]
MADEAVSKRALFITFEGLEGSGKSSIISFLVRYLKKKRLSVKIFREPGSTKVGELLRNILLDKKKVISPYTELLLYLAARTQLIEEKLKKAFKDYDVIICDRFYDSTIAYQGYGLKLGKMVEKVVNIFSLGIKPDLTILLDGNVKKGLKRIKDKDRIEKRPLSFHYRLRRGYRAIAKKEPLRVKVVNADRSLKEIYSSIKKIVDDFLKRKCIKKF